MKAVADLLGEFSSGVLHYETVRLHFEHPMLTKILEKMDLC